MLFKSIIGDYKLPIFSYLFLVFTLFILRLFLKWDIVFLGAILMLLIPILFKKDWNFFYFELSGFIKGLVLSIVVLFFYVLALFLYSELTVNLLSIKGISITFLLLQFFLVVIPEEVFFRGYLQKEFGNKYKSVVMVSVLFAIAHLIVRCAVSGTTSVCTQSALTFFPSLIMGYLFMKTNTIWSSVVFHFLANVVHVLVYVG